MPPGLAVCATWKGLERQTLHLEAAADISPDILPLHSLSMGREVPVVWHHPRSPHVLITITTYYADALLSKHSQRCPAIGGKCFCSMWVRSNEYNFYKYNIRTDINKMPLWPHLYWLQWKLKRFEQSFSLEVWLPGETI